MQDFFLQMIQHLRKHEEVMLYGNLLQISPEEENAVTGFLRTEYETESLEFPFTPPVFNVQAALYGAKIIYFASQLMLYRENKIEDVGAFLPGYEHNKDASAILSADLCLRFLPDILNNLKAIDPEDALITLLEEILLQWHYSGIGYYKRVDELDVQNITQDYCLYQLYINRIIDKKQTEYKALPQILEGINASLGNYREELWN